MRFATAYDAPALAVMDGGIDSNPWSETQYQRACTRGQGAERVLVITDKKRLSGCVVYARVADEVSILKLMVALEARGRGLGASLMHTALAHARDVGARRCLLEVRAANEPALHLYRKLGFREDGLRQGYYPSACGREDAVLMSLNLCNVN